MTRSCCFLKAGRKKVNESLCFVCISVQIPAAPITHPDNLQDCAAIKQHADMYICVCDDRQTFVMELKQRWWVYVRLYVCVLTDSMAAYDYSQMCTLKFTCKIACACFLINSNSPDWCVWVCRWSGWWWVQVVFVWILSRVDGLSSALDLETCKE